MRTQRLLFLLWLMAAAILCFFENNTGTRCVLAVPLLVPALSVACAKYTARHLTLSITVPEETAAGQPCELDLRCEGTRMRHGCVLRGRVRIVNRMTGESCETALTEGRTQITPIHCGYCEIDLTGAAVTDWFGLVRAPLRVIPSAVCTVMPELFPVEWAHDDRTRSQETGAAPIRGANGTETIGIRDYVPGDPVRMIHWKLTEKLDRPVIRENGIPADQGILLLLETHTTPQTTGAEIDLCVRAFLSAAHALCGSGIPFLAALAPDGEMTTIAVSTAEDESLLCRTVLSIAFDSGAESIGRLYAGPMPEHMPRVVLFTPSGETDAVSLAQGRAVDLVVPETAAGVSGLPEIILHTLSQEQPILML